MNEYVIVPVVVVVIIIGAILQKAMTIIHTGATIQAPIHCQGDIEINRRMVMLNL